MDRSVTGDLARVVAGTASSDEGQQIFYVADGLLTVSSEFLQTAMKKKWMEGKGRAVDFPEVRPDIFEIYIKWLYRGRVFTPSKASKKSDGQADPSERFAVCAELYGLGESLLDREFQDCVIDTIISLRREEFEDEDGNMQRWSPEASTVARFYDLTPPGSPARRLVVELWVIKGEASWVDELNLDDRNQVEFLKDITKKRTRSLTSSLAATTPNWTWAFRVRFIILYSHRNLRCECSI